MQLSNSIQRSFLESVTKLVKLNEKHELRDRETFLVLQIRAN